MTAIQLILIIIFTFAVSFVLGYQYCKIRFAVNRLLLLIDMFTLYMNGTLTIEQFTKEYKEKFKKELDR